MKNNLLLLLGITLITLGACQLSNTDQQVAKEPAVADDIDLRDFYAFYKQFHNDSLFQIEHIVFPLEGLPNKADSLTIARGNFRWQKEDWIMHRPVDYEMSDFRRQLIPLSEELVTERIVHESGQYGMIRRFSKIAGDWYLIYYAGVNQLVLK